MRATRRPSPKFSVLKRAYRVMRSGRAYSRVTLWFRTERQRFALRVESRLRRGKPLADPLICVLGCCRQDSIYWSYRVSSVRNGLGYTHYSAEALQMLQIVAGLAPAQPTTRFRNALVALPLTSLMQLRREFDETDMFIVEVASRLKYQGDGDDVYHHVAFDAPPPGLKLAGIRRVEQTDAEIESDLIKIRELVAPRPLIVVSHLVTRQDGKRAELRCGVAKMCERLQVPFIDLLSGCSGPEVGELVEDEPTIAHLTPKGHRYVHGLYQDAIDAELVLQSRRALVQVFPHPESPERYHGLGDFLQGAAYLMRFTEGSDVRARVSLSGSALGDFLVNTYPLSSASLHGMSRFYHEDPVKVDSMRTVMFTNKRISGSWAPVERSELLKACLTPRIEFQSWLDDLFVSLGLTNGEYEVLHVRLGDVISAAKKSIPNRVLGNVRSELSKMTANTSRSVLVLTDAPQLHGRLKSESGSVVFTSSAGHIGLNPFNADVVRSTLTDFFLLGQSKSIRTLSVYPWVSGFAKSASDVWALPLTSARLEL